MQDTFARARTRPIARRKGILHTKIMIQVLIQRRAI